MSAERRQEVIKGLRRWVTWLEANKKNKSTSSTMGSLYQESIASRFNDNYNYQPFLYECTNCEKQYLKLPLDRNDEPQQRCTRCGFKLKVTKEGVSGKKVFAGLIHETGRNTRDPIAEIYNEAFKGLPDVEQSAVYWKFLSPEDQATFAEKQNISVQQLQQALTRAYLYVMGYIDGHKEDKT